MSTTPDHGRRVKFYGEHDLATPWQLERAVEIARDDTSRGPTSMTDAAELHNVAKVIEWAFKNNVPDIPSESTSPKSIRSTVARYFQSIDEETVATQLVDIPIEYRQDILDLLAQSGVYGRCESSTLIQALSRAGFTTEDILHNRQVVLAYPEAIRDAIIKDAHSAEYLIKHFVGQQAGQPIFIPEVLDSASIAKVISTYLESENPHLNLVELLARSDTTPRAGIDARLKLRAKRRHEHLIEAFFQENTGYRTGVEVRIDESQVDPVVESLDGGVAHYSYSLSWLDETLDYPSVLNNFQHLFGYVDLDGSLTMPSFESELGIFERFFGVAGRRDYAVGTAFRLKDSSSLLQLHMYRNYLAGKSIELESVIKWFFEEYLSEEFSAQGFHFTESLPQSTYAHRARHLFSEMEGVINQFRIFCADGIVDHELLALESAPIEYSDIPSLITGKHIEPTDEPDIIEILYTLFSDQSGLTYLSDALHADSAFELFRLHDVTRADLEHYQEAQVERLINFGLVTDVAGYLRVPRHHGELLFRLHLKDCVPRHRLSSDFSSTIEEYASAGWVQRRTTLLSRAEASYFNFMLNRSEFSNGPEYRNKYTHGTQPPPDREAEHFQAYLTALRLLVALVLKINDEFCALHDSATEP